MSRLRAMAGAALAAAALLAAPAAALAQARNDEAAPKSVEELARDAAGELMKALERLVQQLPRYELPAIDGKGDIIIRRKPPHAEPQPRRAPPRAEEREI